MSDLFKGRSVVNLRLTGRIQTVYICPNCKRQRTVIMQAADLLNNGILIECPDCDPRDFSMDIDVSVSGHYIAR